MIELDKAFGPVISRGTPSIQPDRRPPNAYSPIVDFQYSAQPQQPQQQPQQPQQQQQQQQQQPPSRGRTVDQLGQMLGISGNVSESQEFCNMILFIAFGIFAIFILDSLVKLAIRRAK